MVVVSDQELAGAALSPETLAIVTDPALDLSRALGHFEHSESVGAAVRPDPARLARVARTEPGIASRVPTGSTIDSCIVAVADAIDLRRTRRTIGAALERAGYSRQRCDEIDQSIDELLMNALYDAPLDARGQRVFAGVPTRSRVRQRTREVVEVEWVLDDQCFTLAVRDSFGSLDRSTVLRHLRAGVDGKGPGGSRLGGGGLGLYLVAAAANELAFNVIRGVRTEIVCAFRARERDFHELAFFACDAPASVRRTAPARARLANRYRMRRTAATLIGCTVLASGSWLAVRLVRGPPPVRLAIVTTPGAVVELDGKPVGTAGEAAFTLSVAPGTPCRLSAHRDGYAPSRAFVRAGEGSDPVELRLHPLAAIDIESEPSGADVEIDGHPAGTTPLHVTRLTPGASVSLAIAHAGYVPVSVRVDVPAGGATQRVIERFSPDPTKVRLHIVSEPPGARVVKAGQALGTDRTYTPADLFVSVGERQEYELLMPHHLPAQIPPFTPAATETVIEKTIELRPEP